MQLGKEERTEAGRCSVRTGMQSAPRNHASTQALCGSKACCEQGAGQLRRAAASCSLPEQSLLQSQQHRPGTGGQEAQGFLRAPPHSQQETTTEASGCAKGHAACCSQLLWWHTMGSLQLMPQLFLWSQQMLLAREHKSYTTMLTQHGAIQPKLDVSKLGGGREGGEGHG